MVTIPIIPSGDIPSLRWHSKINSTRITSSILSWCFHWISIHWEIILTIMLLSCSVCYFVICSPCLSSPPWTHPSALSPRSCLQFQPEVWAPWVQQSPQSQHVLPLLDRLKRGSWVNLQGILRDKKTKMGEIIHRHTHRHRFYLQFMLICWLSSISSISVGI